MTCALPGRSFDDGHGQPSKGLRPREGMVLTKCCKSSHSTLKTHVEDDFQRRYTSYELASADGGCPERTGDPSKGVIVNAFHDFDELDDPSTPHGVP